MLSITTKRGSKKMLSQLIVDAKKHPKVKVIVALAGLLFVLAFLRPPRRSTCATGGVGPDVLDWKGCFAGLGLSEPKRTIDLSENGLSHLPQGFIAWSKDTIHTLYLSGNGFDEIPDLSALTNLRMLSLRRNKLKVLDCDRLPLGIFHLIVTDNSIEEFKGDCQLRLRNLNKLMMARNRLATFPSDLSLPNLELIRLPQNRLKALPRRLLSTSPRLKWASFAENPCCPEPPSDLPDLGTVDCARGNELGSGTSGVAMRCSDGATVFKRFKQLSSDGSSDAELRISSLLPKNNAHILAPVGTAHVMQSDGKRAFGVVFPFKDALPAGLPPFFGSEDRFPPEKQHNFKASNVWNLAREAACSLEAMHASGVAHMDLYAHNTLLSEKELVILDFGAATCTKFLDPKDARLLHILDVRAFGNLLDNLIEYVISDKDSDGSSTTKLRRLQQLGASGIDSTSLCRGAAKL